MTKAMFNRKLKELLADYHKLIRRKNLRMNNGNGILTRFKYPVLTAAHTPVFWRYDLDYKTNPDLLERMGINAVFNSGALLYKEKYLLAARVEGADRKSFFAIAESPNGVDNFKFRDYPLTVPETENHDINVYDLRLVEHQDSWIYGLFCTERKDPKAPAADTSSAIAQCGIIRTKNLLDWERLPDLRTKSPQQRNVVLHPEFYNGMYAFYTRPQDGFIETGTGGGIGWGLCRNIENAVLENEIIVNDREYHTIKEVKNGLGPAPIKTEKGWLQLAHGVRNTAAGLRYVLYLFLTDLKEPYKVIAEPGGYFLAPEGEERIGDVSNVVFSNGWIKKENGDVYIYYGSSDTRMHAAVTTVGKLLDYVMSTPPDALRSAASLEQRKKMIEKNLKIMKGVLTRKK